tara:strand:- start:3591 stop:4607 length:1017 start_codon:yes stop_codon:yes gene_type:complete
MTIEFSCSHCNKVLKTSDDKAGRRAKCPQCGEPIDVPIPEAATDDEFEGFDEIKAENAVSEEQSFLAASPVREEDSFLAEGKIDCPMCGALIQASTKKCQFCGETLKASARRRQHWEPRIINVGEVFSRSWELFKENLGMCIAAPLLALILYVLGVVVATVVLGVLSVLAQSVAGPEMRAILNIPIVLFFYAMIYLIVFYLQLGMQRVMLQITQGQDPGMGMLFSGGPFLWRMFLCSIIFGIVTSVGYLFLIIPGIILALMFWPFSYLLIDRDLPGIESFTEVRKVTQGNLLSVFLIFLTSFGIAILGTVLTLGIGAVFVLPYLVLVQTVTYAEMTSQ